MPVEQIPPAEPYSTISVDTSFTGETDSISADGVPPYAVHSGEVSSGESARTVPGGRYVARESSYVVEIHTTEYSDTPPGFGTLVGYKIFPTGTFNNAAVPIFPDLRLMPNLEQGESFPPNPDGDTGIRGFVFGDFGSDADYEHRDRLAGGSEAVVIIEDLRENNDLDPLECPGDGTVVNGQGKTVWPPEPPET